ncbi:hypothetical protein CCP4SC76_2900002 [Gammaproteobacteria bacterium]
MISGESAFVHGPQTRTASSENARFYDELVTGQRFYAYVVNDPMNFQDFIGLVTYPVGQTPDPDTQKLADCIEKCLNKGELISSSGKDTSRSNQNDPHVEGKACDIPSQDLDKDKVKDCFNECSESSKYLALWETNTYINKKLVDIPHLHLQTRPGGNGWTGFHDWTNK